MTPQEKAAELFDRFKKATTFRYQEYAGAHYSTFEHDKDTLKECALIAVREIENAMKDCAELSDSMQNMDRELVFWSDVKEQINYI